MGTQYVHDLDYHLRFSAGEEDQPTNMEFRVRGQWTTTVSEQRGDATLVKVELANLKIETPDSAGSQLEASGSSLAKPFFVDYDARGRARGLLVQPDMDSMTMAILREIVATSQFSSPEKASGHWSAVEIDSAGEYQADYRAQSTRSFTRNKSRYLRVAGPEGLASDRKPPTIRGYLARLELDDWGRLAKLESSADVSTPPNAGAAFGAKGELSLKYVSRGKNTEGLPFSTEGLVERSLTLGKAEFESAAENADRNLVAGADALAILRELDGLDPKAAQAASQVRGRLAASFRLDPSGIPRTMKLLKPENASTILGALGSAGTSEAQKTLADVTRDESRTSVERQAAIDSMLTLEKPSRELPEALKTAMRSSDPELKTNASLMLGVMAKKLSDDEPAESQAMVKELTSEFSTTTDPAERQRILGSLGNTGSAEGLAAISESLKSDDPNIRASAASALRFVPGAQADQLLSQVIMKDPVGLVRAAALLAAGFRSYQPLAAALESVAKTEPETSLRAQLVAALANMAGHDGDALVLLDWIAQHDADEKVRAQATRAMESAGTPSAQ